MPSHTPPTTTAVTLMIHTLNNRIRIIGFIQATQNSTMVLIMARSTLPGGGYLRYLANF